VVKLTIEKTGELITSIALLNEDPHLSNDLIYGDINNVTNQIYTEIELLVATDEQVNSYFQECEDDKNQANQVKDKVLKQLKTQDFHIPIRLVSGGLDDA